MYEARSLIIEEQRAFDLHKKEQRVADLLKKRKRVVVDAVAVAVGKRFQGVVAVDGPSPARLKVQQLQAAKAAKLKQDGIVEVGKHTIKASSYRSRVQDEPATAEVPPASARGSGLTDSQRAASHFGHVKADGGGFEWREFMKEDFNNMEARTTRGCCRAGCN